MQLLKKTTWKEIFEILASTSANWPKGGNNRVYSQIQKVQDMILFQDWTYINKQLVLLHLSYSK